MIFLIQAKFLLQKYSSHVIKYGQQGGRGHEYWYWLEIPAEYVFYGNEKVI